MDRPTLVAIIAAYNEEDIIGATVGHLVEQGACVYLLDDGSTDRTVEAARVAAADRLIGVESLVEPGDERPATFRWSWILERKAAVAASLDAAWFIHQDADEFRESPWPHLTLGEAVMLVGRLGWNAIDFEVFNFVPAGAELGPGLDPAAAIRRYQPAATYDRVQIRCWKKTAAQVDLASTGGHEARFQGRRVFPIRFPMRHYPIRSVEQGERKVFRDRNPRFDPDERARGWHVQYDRFTGGAAFQDDAASALPYDAEVSRVALQIRNRLVEAACPSVVPRPAADVAEAVRQVEDDLARQLAHVQALTLALDERQRELDALQEAREETEARLRAALERAAALEATAAAQETALRALETTARALQEELGQANRNALDLARRLEDVSASRSWRVTRPLRAAWRLLGGR
jgi:hypothetical protein